MLDSLRQTWSRDAIGFRQGELEDGDGVATMTVTLIGGPALFVGAILVTVDGLSLGQVLLIAPIGALLGAGVVSSSAAMAAQTGANGAWLLRPSFGRSGSLLVSILRLMMVVLWAVIGLQLAAGWSQDAMTDLEVALPTRVAVVVLGVLGLLLAAAGLVQTIKTLIRKPLFISSVLLLGLFALRLASSGGGFAGGGSESFWQGVQRAVELSAVFVPFVESVARRLDNDEDAQSSFSVSYAIPATLMIAAGGVLAFRLGGIGEMIGIDAGTAAVVAVLAWVLIAEVDQAFSSFVAAGSEATGIVRVLPTWLIGLIPVVAVVVAAMLLPEMPTGWAALAAAIVFPAAVITAFDFHWVNDRYYAETDIYGSGGRSFNVAGVGCWLGAVVLGQLLEPIGPEEWTGLVPNVLPEVDLPWRLIASLVAATAYLLITRWSGYRTTSVYEVRGVNAYGRQDDA